MWTLNDINKFICTEVINTPCPVCKHGVITFHPLLVMFSAYDETHWVTQVEVDARQQGQTCRCDWREESGSAATDIMLEAKHKMAKALSDLESSASRSQAENAAHVVEVLAGQAY